MSYNGGQDVRSRLPRVHEPHKAGRSSNDGGGRRPSTGTRTSHESDGHTDRESKSGVGSRSGSYETSGPRRSSDTLTNLPSRPSRSIAPNYADTVRAPPPSHPPAPAYDDAGVPNRGRVDRRVGPVVNEPAYLHTEDYPFSVQQIDVKAEAQLGLDKTKLGHCEDIPLLEPTSLTLIKLPGNSGFARSVGLLDLECAEKHLDAIKGQVVSHDQLHDFVLVQGEDVVDAMDLVGVVNAPGLHIDVTQRCRVVFTNQNRLIFTQANHSAEVAVPKMRCIFSLFQCFHARSSRRTWSSFYSSINASEILQVFVQQTATTSYESSNCQFNDLFSMLWCTVGGMMKSDKDLEGITQRLADHDPDKFMKRWDKTRFMRYALVIRYFDCATNSVMQTVAMAHPDVPAPHLYQLARSIDACRSITAADWLQIKRNPAPYDGGSFRNSTPSPALFQRQSYKVSMFGLLVVAISFFVINTTAAIFMIIALLGSASASYYDVLRRGNDFVGGGKRSSKTLLASQGGSLVVYGIAVLSTVVSRIG